MVRDNFGEDVSLLSNQCGSTGELNHAYYQSNQSRDKMYDIASEKISSSHPSSTTSLRGSNINNNNNNNNDNENHHGSTLSLSSRLSDLMSTQRTKIIPLSVLIILLFAVGTLIIFKGNTVYLSSNIHTSIPYANHHHFEIGMASPLTGDSDIFASLSASGDLIQASTKCGQFFGRRESNGYVFKGIPFALPPIGSLRWRMPIPVWNESKLCDEKKQFKALEFGGPCFQLNPMSKKFQGTEDCLYLNVWTPQTNETANLDVMVWIHGGSLQFGSGHQAGLRPSVKLAVDLNMVFVSFNYRLYSLGFLDLKDHQETEIQNLSGNFGLADQILALQWIQSNIHNFGGDPNKVTVFGPDAGAASIVAHLTNPSTRTLFSKAWLIGPALYMAKPLSTLDRHAISFINRTICGSKVDTNESLVQCLQSIPPEKVITSFLGDNDPSFRIIDQNDLPIIGIYPEQFLRIDGNLVRDTMYNLQNSQSIDNTGFQHQVPLMIGTAGQAIEFWPGVEQLHTWTWAQYEKYVTTSLDSFGSNLTEAALTLYPVAKSVSDNQTAAKSDINETLLTSVDDEIHRQIFSNLDQEESPETIYASMVSDIRQNCPINQVFQELRKKWTPPVYRYIHMAIPSKPIKIHGYESRHSFHLLDVIAFFNTFDRFIEKPTDEDKNFSYLIQSIIKNFVNGAVNESPNSDKIEKESEEEQSTQNDTFSSINNIHYSNHIQKLWFNNLSKIAIVDNHNISLFDDYAPDRCVLWNNQGLNSFVWVS
ncbi:uncharacterized protein LOC141851648 [Brevipalpus obovatus]|uniref:uncharacterized protein LOC141851648 n=1 Tax=Brevipalpus obovatus TaxID=246614 RepID=UPI003D9DF08C